MPFPSRFSRVRLGIARFICPHRAAIALILYACAASPVNAAKLKWEAPDPADLALKECKDFPEADVEVLLATTKVSEWSLGMSAEHFVRAKIFTERGKEQSGRFSIRFSDSYRPDGVAARVVKPSGDALELQPMDFVESLVYKKGHFEALKKLTLVFPDLRPGDIVEYRWTENRHQFRSLYYFCQSYFPTREYRFSVGDIAGNALVGCVNCPGAKTTYEGGITTNTIRNLPAFVEEDYMPPEKQHRGWIYIIKNIRDTDSEVDMWNFLSDYFASGFARFSKGNGSVTDKAKELVAGCQTDEERLRRLYEFVQENILNTTYTVTEKLRAKIDHHKEQEPDFPPAVLKHQYGTGEEINCLFAAMARGLGFETRRVFYANSDELVDIRMPRSWAFFDSSGIGVKVNGQWRVFQPGSYFVPFGMVKLGAEGAIGLVCERNPKKVQFSNIPTSIAEQNQQRSAARLVLDADGGVNGQVEEVFTGQNAVQRKEAYRDKSKEESEKLFSEELLTTMPGAEITAVTWTNLTTNILPLKVTYQIRMPSYAQKAGTRLLFSPNFFSSGKPVQFSAADRKYPIFFRFPKIEQQDVDIVLPDGYVLDNPSAPSAVSDNSGVLDASYKLLYNAKTRTISCNRNFSLGAKGGCWFKQESYPLLKDFFEHLRQSDTHVIVLKPVAAAPATVRSAP